MAIGSTLKTLTDGLAALTVTGVTRKFTEPPASLGSADLPAQWPGLPSADMTVMTFAGGRGWDPVRCDLVIAVEAVGQNTQSANYAATITIVDNLRAALEGASIGNGKLTGTITANVQVQVADTTYWAVIATVEGR